MNVIRSHTRKYLPSIASISSHCPTHCLLLAEHARLIAPSNANWNRFKAPRRLLANSCNMSLLQSLPGKADRFNGVLVDSKQDDLPTDDSFSQLLQNSLQVWLNEKKRGVWFKVYLEHSHLIATLVKHGFIYHHAHQQYAMLVKWLPTDESSNIPEYAHTLVGVGAVVVNDANEVLVVSEKHYTRPHWKLPGGYVEHGENLVDAAIREVYEETNIHTEFRSVLAFRHGHGGQFNCSDLYAVISLKPLSTNVMKCDREIQECRWMLIDEFLKHPNIHELNRFFVQKYVDNKFGNVVIDCKHGIHQVLNYPYVVYHADKAPMK